MKDPKLFLRLLVILILWLGVTPSHVIAQLDTTHRIIKTWDVIPSASLAAAALITQGKIGRKVHDYTYQQYPHFNSNFDDYLTVAPGVVSLGLAASGVKGKHKLGDQLLLAIISNVFAQVITQSMKRIIKYERPNAVDNHSFPSSHATTAFVNATLLQEEYGQRSALYTIGGYGVASTVGAMRMAKNEHWMADVLMGAGVGIAATKAVYISYPWLQKTVRKIRTKKQH